MSDSLTAQVKRLAEFQERVGVCPGWEKHQFSMLLGGTIYRGTIDFPALLAHLERLRAVEAERDEANTTIGNLQKPLDHIAKLIWGDTQGQPFAILGEAVATQLSALHAELERKDAALRKVLPWLERETPPQYVGVNSEGLPVEYEPTAAEEACGMAAMVILEALQPKEPPCQTA